MGKDSLIKSTSKNSETEKKGAQKKAAAKNTQKTTAAKKPAAKTTKKTAAKASAKPKVTQKAAPKKTQKAVAVKSAAKKKTVAKKVTKPTIRELVHLKFKPMQPTPAATAKPAPTKAHASAPPLISSKDPQEEARLRSVLSQKFSMAQIEAAAKAPAPVVAAAEPASKSAPAIAAETAVEDEKPVAGVTDQSAYITTGPPQIEAAHDPVARAAKIAIGLAAVVVFLLLSVSYNNSAKYYIFPQDNALEIRKGRFSPKGNKFFMVLHGTELTEPVKEVYAKQEVLPLVFNYFLDKADTLLEVPGLPDFDGIKDYLHQAKVYCVTTEMKTAVNSRLDTIERMILLYKAEVAMSKGTLDALQSAIKTLKQAAKFNPSTLQADEINAKITAARKTIATIKAKAAEMPKQTEK